MRTISLVALQQPGSHWLEDLGPEGLVITRRGVPVARLLPLCPERPRSRRNPRIGALRGKLRIRGDLLTTSCRWHAAD